MKHKILAAVTVAMFMASSAYATLVQSSTSSRATFRTCTTTGVTVCDGITAIQVQTFGGLPGALNAAASQTDAAYGAVTGSAQLTGAPGAATLTGDNAAERGKRNGNTNITLQRYTYTGATPATLTFGGLLSFDQTVPAENAGFDPGNDFAVFSGAFAALEIFTLLDADLDAGSTAQDNNFAISGGYTGAPGYASLASANSGGLSNVSGAGTTPLSISVSVNSGDSVWLWALNQNVATNGARVHGSLDTYLQVTPQQVPEPGALALVGLSLAGLALAGRRRG